MKQEAKIYETRRYRCLVCQDRQSEDLWLRLCGIEACVPGRRFETNDREGYHLHVILSGKGRLFVEAREMTAELGQMFLTRPGQRAWYEPDLDEPWSYCWMCFDGRLAESYAAQIGFSESCHILPCLKDPMQFYEIVKRALHYSGLSLAHEVYRDSALLSFIGLALESRALAEPGIRQGRAYTTEAYVDYVLDYIHGNYATITVADIARYIGLHRSYLTSIFKKQMGQSPQEYLVSYKLGEGARLLRETELPIREIAYRIGYDNPLTFSKVFKNSYGQSPSDYRREEKRAE